MAYLEKEVRVGAPLAVVVAPRQFAHHYAAAPGLRTAVQEPRIGADHIAAMAVQRTAGENGAMQTRPT
jgi:hypothetical protein